MGLIERVFEAIFGGGRNVVRETAEVFWENREAGAIRAAQRQADALDQYAAEFSVPQRGRFDRVMDGLNRLPRPALALGTLGLFVAAMVDPVWFASRMQGIALVPEPLWWLLGAIVSFYFGARHQVKSQEFQRSIQATTAQVPHVIENLTALDEVARQNSAANEDAPVSVVVSGIAAGTPIRFGPDSFEDNAALRDWARQRGKLNDP